MRFRNRQKSKKGIALVETIVGIFMMLIIIVFATHSLMTLNRASTRNKTRATAQNILQTVAEEIRAESASKFDVMQGTADRTKPDMLNIKLTSTIGDVDPSNRTRSVSLTALWMENNTQQSEAINFTISQIRAHTEGSILHVKIVATDGTTGIANVVVSAAGQDAAIVTGVTDTNGLAIVMGAMVTVQGVKIQVNGQNVKAYFADNSSGQWQYSFSKEFQTGRTLMKEVNRDFESNPISMRLPSKVKIKVTDTSTNTGVPDGTVQIFPKQQILPFTMNESDKVRITNSEGNCEFADIIPGQYWIFFVGDTANKYAALATVDDNIYAAPGNQNNYFNVGNDSEVSFEFKTMPRGRLRGNIKGVYYSQGAGKFLTRDINTADFPLWIYKDSTIITGTKSDNSPISVNLFNTMSNRQLNELPRNQNPVIQVNVNGANSASFDSGFLSPSILYDVHNTPSDPVYNAPSTLHSQYNLVDVRCVQGDWYHAQPGSPDPLTPIIVSNPGDLATTKFLAVTWNGEAMYAGYADNRNTDHSADFRTKIYPGAHPDNENVTVYLLERSALGSIRGRILNQDGTPFTAAAGTISNSFRYDTDSLGQLSYNPYFGLNSLIMNGGISATTKIVNGEHTYSTSQDSAFPRSVPPNVNNEKTKVIFETRVDTTINVPFNGNVVATTKINESGVVKIVQLDPTAINIPEIELHTCGWCNPAWNTTVAVNGGKYTTTPQPITQKSFLRGSNHVTVAPGADVDCDIKVDPTPAIDYSSPYISSNGDPDQLWAGAGDGLFGNSNDGFKESWKLPLYQIIVTGPIYGKVVDATTGAPILGATVKITKSGGPTAPFQDSTTTTIANAGPMGDQQFYFPSLKTLPIAGTNLTITVSAPLYGVYTDSIEAYQGITKEWNFSIMLPSSGPPSNGPANNGL